MTTIKQQKWYVSGQSTAAGIVVQKTSTAANQFAQKRLKLEGYSIMRGSTVASTVTAKLRIGVSSGAITSSESIGIATAPYVKVVTGLGIEAGFFAITGGTTANDGTVAELWGSYA